MIGRILSRMLHRLIRGTVEHPIRFVIVLVALFGAAALMIFQAGLPAMSLALPTAQSFRVGNSAPASTENYMKGTETFNADLVWNALSDDAQNRYRSRGGSMQQLQQQMDQARQAGAQLENEPSRLHPVAAIRPDPVHSPSLRRFIRNR